MKTFGKEWAEIDETAGFASDGGTANVGSIEDVIKLWNEKRDSSDEEFRTKVDELGRSLDQCQISDCAFPPKKK